MSDKVRVSPLLTAVFAALERLGFVPQLVRLWGGHDEVGIIMHGVKWHEATGQ